MSSRMSPPIIIILQMLAFAFVGMRPDAAGHYGMKQREPGYHHEKAGYHEAKQRDPSLHNVKLEHPAMRHPALAPQVKTQYTSIESTML